MTRPMHPEVARAWLDKMEPMMNYQREALETVAAMTVEEDWRLVSTDHNGGKYEKERWTRLASEWAKDA